MLIKKKKIKLYKSSYIVFKFGEKCIITQGFASPVPPVPPFFCVVLSLSIPYLLLFPPYLPVLPSFPLTPPGLPYFLRISTCTLSYYLYHHMSNIYEVFVPPGFGLLHPASCFFMWTMPWGNLPLLYSYLCTAQDLLCFTFEFLDQYSSSYLLTCYDGHHFLFCSCLLNNKKIKLLIEIQRAF